MKTIFAVQISREVVVALVTIVVIMLYNVIQITMAAPLDYDQLVLLVGLFLIFSGSFIYSTNKELCPLERSRFFQMALQISAVLGLYFTAPLNFIPVLATIWATQLPHYFSFARCVLITGLLSLVLLVVNVWYWQLASGYASALIYWMFSLFAVMTMIRMIAEQQAKEAANQINRELLATQSLLSQASRQSERLRIARNIHDVLGHHLTALTINLQVASHLTEGQAKTTIDQSHAIAKLLLSDVREAVSEIRDMSVIDLRPALQRLFANTPRMTIHFSFDDQVKITEVTIAEVIIRVVQEAITNALKHGTASNFWVSLSRQPDGQRIQLAIKDDGFHQPPSQVKTDDLKGNGLKGMVERVNGVGGTIAYHGQRPYFIIEIEFDITEQG